MEKAKKQRVFIFVVNDEEKSRGSVLASRYPDELDDDDKILYHLQCEMKKASVPYCVSAASILVLREHIYGWLNPCFGQRSVVIICSSDNYDKVQDAISQEREISTWQFTRKKGQDVIEYIKGLEVANRLFHEVKPPKGETQNSQEGFWKLSNEILMANVR
jgi:hypothetical protein